MVQTISLVIPPTINVTDDQFYQICAANREFRLERNAKGEIEIMPPTGGETSRQNSQICLELGLWNRQTQAGIVFDSSGGFRLPNGANRSPDAAWIPLNKWNTLTPEERTKFLPFAPDFALELRSASDDLSPLQAKMQEYIENGTRLGWLINGQDRQVEIYRPRQMVEVLNDPLSLTGENVLSEFVLDLRVIWGESN
ncbi:MAG: Uma2 family endonuclease [Kamptonema sp. SIO4C4]|nr:Uma2 family endonuclease [Kamptonema sp. SIO4C4]